MAQVAMTITIATILTFMSAMTNVRRGIISIVEVKLKRAAPGRLGSVPDLCRGVPPWAPRVRRQGAPTEGRPYNFAASKQFSSEEKPDAELDVTRLIEVSVASRDTEDIEIIEIQAWQTEAPPVEGVEELGPHFDRSRFSQVDLLQDVEIFREEGLSTQATIGRRRVAKEPQRIGVVCRVSRSADICRAKNG